MSPYPVIEKRFLTEFRGKKIKRDFKYIPPSDSYQREKPVGVQIFHINII